MKRLNVLFLPPAPSLTDPWQDDVVRAIGDRHHLLIFDAAHPLEPQFREIQVVIDFGGSIGTRAMADVAGSVLLWQVLGNGIDHFELEYFRSKRIRVANCPGENTAVPLAELAFMFMLQLSRGWRESERNLRQGVMYKPLGSELAGRTLGLLGFGATGRQLAFRARAFDMQVIAVDKRPVPAAEKRKFGVSRVLGPESLDAMLGESDYVSVHLHLTPETRHILNAQRLAAMKRGSFLINVSRGALVDERALADALASGHLAGAGLDAFSEEPPSPQSPLLTMDNVMATPHIAGLTSGTSRRRAEFAALNVNRVAEGLDPLGLIDKRADVAVFSSLSDLFPPESGSRPNRSDQG
jgi:phosphoglycerate dehydrogenase-like enzyme